MRAPKPSDTSTAFAAALSFGALWVTTSGYQNAAFPWIFGVLAISFTFVGIGIWLWLGRQSFKKPVDEMNKELQRPAFDLYGGSKAELVRTTVRGVPHNLVRAEGGSKFTATDSMIVAENLIECPPPDGKYANATNDDLKAAVAEIKPHLEGLKRQSDNAMHLEPTPGQSLRDAWVKIHEGLAAVFTTKFQGPCLSIASEIMRRIGPIERNRSLPLDIRLGADAIRFKPSGDNPYGGSAAFLEFIAGKLG